MNCFRYFEMLSFSEVDELELTEYFWLLESIQWKKLDEEYRIHRLAWVDRQVNIMDKKSKYIYTEFNKFFNEKEIKQMLGLKVKSDKRLKMLARLAKEANEKGG